MPIGFSRHRRLVHVPEGPFGSSPNEDECFAGGLGRSPRCQRPSLLHQSHLEGHDVGGELSVSFVDSWPCGVIAQGYLSAHLLSCLTSIEIIPVHLSRWIEVHHASLDKPYRGLCSSRTFPASSTLCVCPQHDRCLWRKGMHLACVLGPLRRTESLSGPGVLLLRQFWDMVLARTIT